MHTGKNDPFELVETIIRERSINWDGENGSPNGQLDTLPLVDT